MVDGYAGKILWVDLSTGKMVDEVLEEKFCRDFIGGYGFGARILYNRQKAGVDALGPENTLGLVTGPLTGSPAVTGTRYTAIGKSPLTGGWGDANSGGHFGSRLKSAGYDGIFFTGIADKPVYLLIDNGKAVIKDAKSLWGKDSYETEDTMQTEYGKDSAVSCIGPSGEKLSFISGIITSKGAAAGRSGLGAVMGSKKLKAVVVRGNQDIHVANMDEANRLRKEHIAEIRKPDEKGESMWGSFHKYGTTAMTEEAAHSGDSPVKNWGGVGIIDFPDASGLRGDAAIANLARHEACTRCPIACQALLKEGSGEYKYAAGARRPEYETQAAFGTLCLNNNTESIAMANDICNRYGLDTISTGTVIAFGIECYENGIITKKDTGGIELTWGNHRSIVVMTEKIAKREGFGDVLADGVKLAAKKIGKGADKYAVHIGGQELGMHDPKLPSPMCAMPAARYLMDATPGRHTQDFGPTSFQNHIINAAGMCLFGVIGVPADKYITGYMRAVTGLNYSWNELLKAGERILNMRHLFNLREEINELQLDVHPRIIGKPPLKKGPLAGVTADIEAQVYWNMGTLDWDMVTTKPSKQKLLKLGLKDVVKELYAE